MKTNMAGRGSDDKRAIASARKEMVARSPNRGRRRAVLRSTTGCGGRIQDTTKSGGRLHRATLPTRPAPDPGVWSPKHHRTSRTLDSSDPEVPRSCLQFAVRQVCGPRPDSASSARALSMRMRASALSSWVSAASARASSRRRRASAASIWPRSSASSARTMTW